MWGATIYSSILSGLNKTLAISVLSLKKVNIIGNGKWFDPMEPKHERASEDEMIASCGSIKHNSWPDDDILTWPEEKYFWPFGAHKEDTPLFG